MRSQQVAQPRAPSPKRLHLSGVSVAPPSPRACGCAAWGAVARLQSIASCSASTPGPRLCPWPGTACSFPSLQHARAAWWCSAMHWQHAKQAVYNR